MKPLVLPAAIPVGWWLWSRRRLDHLAMRGRRRGRRAGSRPRCRGASADVWRQSIAYNGGAGPRYAKLGQLRKLFSTLGSRDVLVLAALILLVDHRSSWSLDRPVDRGAADVMVLAVWAVCHGAGARARTGDVPQPPRRDRAAARAAGRVLARPRACCWSCSILLAPWSAHNLHSILVPSGYRGDDAALMHPAACAPVERPGDQRRSRLRLPRRPAHAEADERHLEKRIDQHLLTTASVARRGRRPARVRGRRLVGTLRPATSAACPPRCAMPGSSPPTATPAAALWLRPTCPD